MTATTTQSNSPFRKIGKLFLAWNRTNLFKSIVFAMEFFQPHLKLFHAAAQALGEVWWDIVVSCHDILNRPVKMTINKRLVRRKNIQTYAITFSSCAKFPFSCSCSFSMTESGEENAENGWIRWIALNTLWVESWGGRSAFWWRWILEDFVV